MCWKLYFIDDHLCTLYHLHSPPQAMEFRE